jgi:signal transduction histidine kinase
VDDLLDMSRITRGKMQINGVPMDLNAAVTRAVEAARPLVDAGATASTFACRRRPRPSPATSRASRRSS